ncbi:hypothetical protein D3C81_1860090 [compost metagenome]
MVSRETTDVHLCRAEVLLDGLNQGLVRVEQAFDQCSWGLCILRCGNCVLLNSLAVVSHFTLEFVR